MVTLRTLVKYKKKRVEGAARWLKPDLWDQETGNETVAQCLGEMIGRLASIR
jgi:hypothetical protein